MSISPKLSNSVPLQRDGGRWTLHHERLRYQPAVLQELTARWEYQLKFVVDEPDDLREIEHICSEVGARPGRVLLMPEGTTREALREKGLWLAELCKATGYRFSPRLHVELWGNERGR
jgi:7-carboxy-7-deazaguanine synthase